MLRFFPLLALATLAVALPSLAGDTPSKRDDSASEKLGIKLSLQCWTYNRLTFFETADRAVALGVKYLEMFPGQKLKPDSDVKVGRTMNADAVAEVKKKLADNHLKLIAYGVDSVPTDEAGARKTFEWAKDMGIGVLVTETRPTELHDKLCQEFGIKFALHNHPTTWPPDEVLKACEGRSKWIGSCSDTGHWMRAEFVPVDTFKKLEGRVLHSHFKDLNEFGKQAHDVVWGTGRGNARGMLEELKRQGYKGYLSIEYEYGNLEHLDTNLPKCVEFFDRTMTELAK
jgi:sugar phosphate isomerase/epimerase